MTVGGRPGLPSLIDLRFLWTYVNSNSNTSTKKCTELRSCVKIGGVLGSPCLLSRIVSVDVKHHGRRRVFFFFSRYAWCGCSFTLSFNTTVFSLAYRKAGSFISNRILFDAESSVPAGLIPATENHPRGGLCACQTATTGIHFREVNVWSVGCLQLDAINLQN